MTKPVAQQWQHGVGQRGSCATLPIPQGILWKSHHRLPRGGGVVRKAVLFGQERIAISKTNKGHFWYSNLWFLPHAPTLSPRGKARSPASVDTKEHVVGKRECASCSCTTLSRGHTASRHHSLFPPEGAPWKDHPTPEKPHSELPPPFIRQSASGCLWTGTLGHGMGAGLGIEVGWISCALGCAERGYCPGTLGGAAEDCRAASG